METEVKPKRKKRILLKTKRYQVMTPLQIVMIVLCVLIAIGIVTAFVLVVLQPCASDENCPKSSKCSVNYCDHGWCHQDWIEGCCVEDVDCAQVECYSSICDRGTCRVLQLENSTACDDHNLCTANDICISGKCVGNTLNCNVNSCSDSICDKSIGCIYNSKDDNTPCDDNNLCTVNDICLSGLCASGINKDCSHLDGVCTVGVCDQTTGACVSADKADGTLCDDGVACSANDQCVSGQCAGQLNDCDDNNPCTVNKCVSGIGCMIQYQYDLNNTCQPGCTDDSSCPNEFICHDGTCIKIPLDSSIDIRFLDYTIENCSYLHNVLEHRLIMSFTMDADKISIAGTEYYQIVKEISDITTPTAQPLGFIDAVLNLNSAELETNHSRTAFALTTACQTVDSSNCATIFANKNYDFDAHITTCENISPNSNCIDPDIHVQAHVPVSISDCSMFPQNSVITVYGEATAYFLNDVFTRTGVIDVSNNPDERLFIALNTTVKDNPHFVAHNFYITACQAKELHPYRHCVLNEAGPPCPLTGCFGWDDFNSFDSPIKDEVHIMQLGYFTAIAESLLSVNGAFETSTYSSPHQQRCTAQKKTTWSKGGDDGFSIDPEYFRQTIVTFDMIYRVTACDHSLRSTQQHQITTLQLI